MRIPTNKISDISKFYFKELDGVYPHEELKSILYILYHHFLGLNKIQVVTESDRRVNESDLILLYKGMEAVKNHVPIQYVIKKSEFFGNEFYVDSRVLIPRPETEELVQWIIDDYQNAQMNAVGIDLCTGSGCIAISLKKGLDNIQIQALEFSKDALEVAKTNAKKLNANITFIEADILNLESWKELDNYDFIVSNPPYVTESEKKLMRKNVLEQEPHLALFVEDRDPLIFYRTILENGKSKLKQHGAIYFEINEQFGAKIENLALELGYSKSEIRKDYFGKDRMIKIYL